MNKKMLWLTLIAASLVSGAAWAKDADKQDRGERYGAGKWEKEMGPPERMDFKKHCPGGDCGGEMMPGKDMKKNPDRMKKYHSRTGEKTWKNKAGKQDDRQKMGRHEKPESWAEREKELLDKARKNDPSFAAKLDKFKTEQPVKYRVLSEAVIRALFTAARSHDAGREKDAVKSAVLEFDARELAAGYDKASDKEKEKIRKDLELKVSELFDMRIREQDLRIKKMEEDISKLRAAFGKRKTRKAAIVDNRVKELLGEGDSW
ncbi:MAG: hypothetical protein ABIG11_03220 [bacterium]